MPADCLVLIPAATGGGTHEYYIDQANGSHEGARQALDQHEKITKRPMPEEAVITVIVGGISLMLWNALEHNEKQPTYRHLVSRIRNR